MRLGRAACSILLMVFLALAAGCGRKQGMSSRAPEESEAVRELFAMDTYMTLRVFGGRAEEAADAAETEIRRLEELLSTGLEDSEVSVLNRQREAAVSEDTLELVTRAKQIHEETAGAFDITVYPLMEAWGFTDQKYRIPSPEEREKLLGAVDIDAVVVDPEEKRISLEKEKVRIDLGGIAKGYTSDRLMELFRSYGSEHAMVSLGGNVQVLGEKPDGTTWRIGIEDPREGENLLGVLSVKDMAVITSGGYERFFEENGKRYHHILDPKTGMPAENGLVSVTIVCKDGTLADGLSTALFVMGREQAAEYWRNRADEFDVILQEEDGTLWVSEGLAEVFEPAAENAAILRRTSDGGDE